MLSRLLSLTLLLLVPVVLHARPAHRRALVELLELPAASRLNDCTVCHLPAKAGAEEGDRPHNPFGARLAEMRSVLRKQGKPSDITARLLAVADEDADRDGVANLVELLAGGFPGDATDKPSAEQITVAKKKQVALLASLTGYRWRPFERVVRPTLPVVKRTDWGRNAIDTFVLAEQEKHGLTPRPEASREVLLRRVTIDLTGLPPTAKEITEFLADTAPGAYERVVDRLLNSPRYGERWGRHWMDVWRYSDWAGFGAQIRDSQPHVWHWRDWIIESLNKDKPYDRMVQEMLAGDELAPDDLQTLRATGFLVRNYKLLSREKWLQDAVDHTAMAFLGITMGCAKCHDHFYDPLTQKEYYQFRAFFTPHKVRTDRLPGIPDVKVNGLPRVYDADLNAPTYFLIRGDDRNPDKKPLTASVPESLGGKLTITPINLPREAYDPDRRAFITTEEKTRLLLAVTQAEQALATARRNLLGGLTLDARPLQVLTQRAKQITSQASIEQAEFDLSLAQARLTAFEAVLRVEAMEPAGPKPSETYQTAAKAAVDAQRRLAVLDARQAVRTAEQAVKKAAKNRRAAAEKQLTAAKQALTKAESALKQPTTTAYTKRKTTTTYPTTSTGRRLALARWIAHRDNPLAARVAVNHLWARHFGRGLAPSMFDFGRNGQPPSHPALLDWLAAEFMERGWKMKEFHRLILTSATYRQSSTPETNNLQRDPDNVYLWRFTPRRVEAEVVRDSIFYVAGKLDLTQGGPDIPHAQGLTLPRRSLYFQHAAEKQMEFLQIFDNASVTECYQRKQAIMPQQALALINSDLVVQHARIVAGKLHEQAKSDNEAFLVKAFQTVLTRRPTAQEQSLCLTYLSEQTAALNSRKVAKDATLRARENLLHVLMNHHEFVTLR